LPLASTRMNTLSKKCKYGLRAVYCLARLQNQASVSSAWIAEHESIPRKFLEAILLQMRQAGIVDSRQGKGGGYHLAMDPGAITIGSIVRAIDGPLAPLPCVSDTAYRRCEECPDETQCETRLVMKQLRDAISGVLDQLTVADVCRRTNEAKAAGLTYEI
jgi:Rrf2 family protein